jgi:hypothetical protein
VQSPRDITARSITSLPPLARMPTPSARVHTAIAPDPAGYRWLLGRLFGSSKEPPPGEPVPPTCRSARRPRRPRRRHTESERAA